MDVSYREFFLPFTTRKAKIFIVVIGVIVYFTSLFNGFVWDDIPQIRDNPAVHSISNVYLFFTGSTFVAEDGEKLAGAYYRPMMTLAFSSIATFFGVEPFYFRLFQILVHIVNGILLFTFFEYFFKRQVAFFLAVAFLVHSINSEAVLFISSLQDPLFLFFGLVAILLSLKEGINTKRMIGIGGLLLCALLSKESAILFLFVIPLYHAIFRTRKLLLMLVSGFLALLCYFFMRFVWAGLYLEKLETMVPIRDLSLWERLLHAPAILFYFIKTFLLPIHLAVDQLWTITAVDMKQFYGPLILVLLFFLTLVWLGVLVRKVRDKVSFQKFAFFFLWFLAGLVIHIHIFPLDMTVAERWFYFSSVGLLGLLGMIYTSLFSSRRGLRIVIIATAIAWLIFLSLRTMQRNLDWGNQMTLFTQASKVSDNFDIQNILGSEYSRLQKYDQALVHYQKSAEHRPYGVNLYNIANTYDQLNNPQKAEEYYRKALEDTDEKNDQERKFHVAFVYAGLAKVFLYTDRPESAKEAALAGLDANPEGENLLMLLALSEYAMGHHKDALIAAKKAHELVPNESNNYIYNQISSGQAVKMVGYQNLPFFIGP